MSIYDYNEHKIEQAIEFLVKTISNSGHNPKPVVLHSIRVAEVLWSNCLPEETIIAGILHDTAEDSSIGIDDIKKEFGNSVSNIVGILTLTKLNTIDVSFKKSLDSVAALNIRAADLIDNSNYYNRAGSKELSQRLYDKYTNFMHISQGKIDKALEKNLIEHYKSNVKPLIKNQ